MDEQSQMEARRRKVLNNAEARLRFIKEGIPWRNNEDQNKIVPTQDTEAASSTVSTSNQDVASLVDASSKPSLPDNSSMLFESAQSRLSSNTATIPDCGPSEKSSDFKTSSDNNLPSSEKGLIQPSTKSLEENVPISNVASRPGSDSSDVLRTLRSLLKDSSAEREEMKRNQARSNRDIWVCCLVMLLQGIVCRLSYTIGLSWLFNDMMLVPCLVGSVTLTAALSPRQSPPSGALTQALLMAGIRAPVLTRAYSALNHMRTFLQFFSVYLVGFVFTHEFIKAYNPTMDTLT